MLQQKPKAKVKATPDSTKLLVKKEVYLNERLVSDRNLAIQRNPNKSWKQDTNVKAGQKAIMKAQDDRRRQVNKGKAGYDKNGYSLKK